MLLQVLCLESDAPRERRIAGLEKLLRQHQIPVNDSLQALGSLLWIEDDASKTTASISPDMQRQLILESTLRIIVGLAAEKPVLLVCEDLHWADPSTIELLSLLVGQVPTTRLFVLLTARPTFVQPWPARTYATQLSLEPFTQAESRQMVTELVGSKALPAELLDQLIARSDGVPLFAEELVKYVLESGLLREEGDQYQLIGESPEMAIPSTLQDSLMARLDRLEPLKSLVQLAATLGREFSYTLLRAVSPNDETELRGQLAGLVDAELIFQRGLPPTATYMFKHALIQDAAYQSLLKSTRRRYHQRIAEVLSQAFPETAATQPEILAHHYTKARLTEEAITNWKRAGDFALLRSAYPEAFSHLSQALALVADLPAGIPRVTRELDLQVALAPALDATKGVSSPEVKSAYDRAWELCQQLEDTSQNFAVLMGLRRFYFVRGDLGTARSVAEQLASIAQSTGETVHLVETDLAFGVTSLWQGKFPDAQTYLELGIKHFDASTFRQAANTRVVNVSDPLVNCFAVASWAMWINGATERSLARSDQSIEYARRLEHPLSIALALDYAAALRAFRGETKDALQLADEGIALCKNKGLKFWLGLLTVRRGWALSRSGKIIEGLEDTRSGMDIWNKTGAKLAKPFLLSILAETLMRTEQFDEARAALDEALADGNLRGEHFYEAEVHRLSGELSLLSGRPADAEASLTRALEVARSQGAHAFALRAATSIARHWSTNGMTSPAGTLLAGICETFTEDQDSLDLIQARDLLAAIKAQA